MLLEFDNDTFIVLPRTLGIDKIRNEIDYEAVRAPFSTTQTLAGDGRPKAEPFTISGTAYFPDTSSANSWIMDLRSRIHTARGLFVEGWAFVLHAADLVIVPTLLPRILNVTIRVYPASVEPLSWPDGLTLEYRFDEGEGSTLTEYVSGANATITNPVWDSTGLIISDGTFATLPAAATTLLESNSWTQFMAMVGEGTTPADGGVVGSLTNVSLSGEMYRYTDIFAVPTLKTSLVTGVNVINNVGGDLWDGTPRILHSFRSSGTTRGLDTIPEVGPSYLYIGGASGTGVAGTRTFGRNDTSYMHGKLMYYVAFNRSLLTEEKIAVYNYIRILLAERGVSLIW